MATTRWSTVTMSSMDAVSISRIRTKRASASEVPANHCAFSVKNNGQDGCASVSHQCCHRYSAASAFSLATMRDASGVGAFVS